MVRKKKKEVFISPSDHCWEEMNSAVKLAEKRGPEGALSEALDAFMCYCILRMQDLHKGRVTVIVPHPNKDRQRIIEAGMHLMLAEMDSEAALNEARAYFRDKGFTV